MMKSKQRIFYGWWIVVGCFFLNFSAIGVVFNTLGVFIRPVSESLGFTRGGFTLYFTISALSMMFTAPFVGKLIERFSLRLVVTISSIILTASFVLFSQCRTLGQFYILGVFSGIGLAGSSIIPVSNMITHWFVDKRGLAMGIVFAATGIGGLTANPLANWIIVNHGWQAAYLSLGLLVGILTIPVAIFVVRGKPADMGLRPLGAEAAQAAEGELEGVTLTEAIKMSTFWLFALLILFTNIANMGVLHHIIPYLTDLGYASSTAAMLVSFHMGVLMIGKVVTGRVADKLGLIKCYVLLIICMVASILLLYGMQVFWVAIAFCIIFGFASPVITVFPPLFTAKYLGRKHFAIVYGVLSIFSALGTALGTPLSGFIHDWTKSYYPAFAIYIGMAVIAGVVGLVVMNRGNKILEGLVKAAK